MVKPIIKDRFFLARKSVPATAEDAGLAQDLIDTIEANKAGCAGLAANMIGVAKRAIVFNENGKYIVMFNPEIVRCSSPFEAEEGCLSLPGQRKVRRYLNIKVQYQTPEMKTRVKTYSGWTAEIIQHEIDHCNGVLI